MKKNKKKIKRYLKIKNKFKGFTLVELLAVIVILAIIMVIAIPSVLETLTTAKIKTFREFMTKTYISSEKKYLSDMLKTSESPDCVIYKVEQDLGMASTGDFNGYVLVKKINGNSNYFLTLNDGTYMVSDIQFDKDSDNVTLQDFTYIEDNVLTKEYLAAAHECNNFTYIDEDGKTVKESTDDYANQPEGSKINKYVIAVYKYDEDSSSSDYCITGDESTCKESNCLESLNANSCSIGTVIKYKVNSYETLSFNVLHDNGSTITMQYQKNNASAIKWYAESSDYTKGPVTALAALENATSNWTNVNQLTYTPGTTVLYSNYYTGCNYDSCTKNVYTLATRTAYARMITTLEAYATGCRSSKGSCPIFMYNYIYKCNKYVKDCPNPLATNNGNEGYWTMSAMEAHEGNAIDIRREGRFNDGTSQDESQGVRAVVEINKQS